MLALRCHNVTKTSTEGGETFISNELTTSIQSIARRYDNIVTTFLGLFKNGNCRYDLQQSTVYSKIIITKVIKVMFGNNSDATPDYINCSSAVAETELLVKIRNFH